MVGAAMHEVHVVCLEERHCILLPAAAQELDALLQNQVRNKLFQAYAAGWEMDVVQGLTGKAMPCVDMDVGVGMIVTPKTHIVMPEKPGFFIAQVIRCREYIGCRLNEDSAFLLANTLIDKKKIAAWPELQR